jgi:hypothetical protein
VLIALAYTTVVIVVVTVPVAAAFTVGPAMRVMFAAKGNGDTMTNPGHLIVPFCKLVEKEMNEEIAVRHPILHENAVKAGTTYYTVGYDEGKRFWKVWAGYQDGGKYVRYFVERSTGIIFGAKGWNAYNPNHEYGTLETMDEWNWSGYYAKSKAGKSSFVPQGQRR